MSKNRRIKRLPGMVSITIDNKTLPITLARFTYRCEVCNGELSQIDNRLHCKQNAQHRGLIHQSEAAARQTRQTNNLADLPYQIIDGKVVLKNGN